MAVFVRSARSWVSRFSPFPPLHFERCDVLRRFLGVAALVLAGPLGCYSGAKTPDREGTPDAGPPAVITPFEAVPPSIYVGKVKNVLVGLAPTEAEVRSVEADPA